MEIAHILKLKKWTSYFLLYSIIISTISCTNNENSNDADAVISRDLINTVLLEMKTIGDKQGKVVTFNLENLLKEDYNNHFQLTTLKAYKFATGKNDLQAGKIDSNYNYVVTCNYSDGRSKVTRCGSDVSCAGAATWNCLDSGGCATICDAKPTLVYIPSLDVDENPVELSQKIEEILIKTVNHLRKSNSILAFSISVNEDKSDFQINKFINIKSSNKTNSLLEKSGNEQYRVTCMKNGNVVMDFIYNTKIAASEAILFCTDQLGGCAEICDVVVLAAPLPFLKEITLETITQEILPDVL